MCSTKKEEQELESSERSIEHSEYLQKHDVAMCCFGWAIIIDGGTGKWAQG